MQPLHVAISPARPVNVAAVLAAPVPIPYHWRLLIVSPVRISLAHYFSVMDFILFATVDYLLHLHGHKLLVKVTHLTKMRRVKVVLVSEILGVPSTVDRIKSTIVPILIVILLILVLVCAKSVCLGLIIFKFPKLLEVIVFRLMIYFLKISSLNLQKFVMLSHL